MEEESFFYKQLGYLVVFVLGAGIVFGFYSYQNYLREQKNLVKRNREQAELLVKQKIIQQREEQELKIKQEFSKIKLEADSVFIQDIKTKNVIFEKNSRKKQSIASLTKLVTALVVLEDKTFQEIEIKWEHLLPEGEYFLKVGEIFKKEDLVDFMLSISSNDAARALSSQVSKNIHDFVKKMNQIALELELDSTFFFSDTGLDVADSIGGSYSSARDINNLLIYFYKNYPKIVQETSQAELEICSNIICHHIKNTNILLADEKSIVFSKTGYTDFSGGSLGVIVNINNKTYSIIILNSSKEGRFKDVANIIRILKNLN